MKPIPLLAYPIMNSSMANSLVLDLFGGSGSTLIACEQTHRIYTIELDEKFPMLCEALMSRSFRCKCNCCPYGLTYKRGNALA